ncbi:hypothetical protein QBC35DRAFT_504459 [Podospora australis]|uniref:Uncharacterized protein n=1 Tax=Podospora australis TaxID=1536484 RepID=A0AAN6WPH1_9PEZI|nr:hypothetical protein QBC35DRAFT_504459 [Podospora australis]
MKQHPGVIAWLCATAVAAGGVGTTTPTTTTTQSSVSVYLPEYGSADWARLRGSILGSDQSATTYTVFCADSPDCQLAGDLPFVFTEGPSTLIYGGSAPGTLTADLECKLDGKSAATCIGSSSIGPNHWQGTLTGPTQTVWTKTFSAPEVTWGLLSLTTPGPTPTTLELEGTAAASLPGSKSSLTRVPSLSLVISGLLLHLVYM